MVSDVGTVRVLVRLMVKLPPEVEVVITTGDQPEPVVFKLAQVAEEPVAALPQL
jgi:hypothetical protein